MGEANGDRVKATMSVAEVAMVLGVAPETVRYRLEKGQYRFGSVFPPRTRGGRKSYEIYREQFNRFIGREG